MRILKVITGRISTNTGTESDPESLVFIFERYAFKILTKIIDDICRLLPYLFQSLVSGVVHNHDWRVRFSRLVLRQPVCYRFPV